MTNIYDTANQIEQELRTLPEFTALKDAHAAVDANADSKALFKEFMDLQKTLHDKQMTGAEFSDEDAKSAQAISERVQADELIGAMMEKEHAFSVIVDDLNRIIMSPVRELYEAK